LDFYNHVIAIPQSLLRGDGATNFLLKENSIEDFDNRVVKGLVGRLGQLSEKLEAAGKVRVFAMVDVWTQSVLKPLHDTISDILRSLPNDGTFNQGEAVKRCFSKSALYGKSFGYDLSAATDRLPISLQVSVLSGLLGHDIALAWKELLIERSYVLRSTGGCYNGYKYSVGQPMGALSSFNMLALTHHLIVQYCARLVHPYMGRAWWDQYELLGDDIVIFDAAVAGRYLHFMESIGLAINVNKSVVAKNETFEFAKVTGHKGLNVSAVSWRMFISQNSFIGRANIAFSLLRKGMVVRFNASWLMKILRHRRYSSGDLNLSLSAVWSMFAGSGMVGISEFLRSLYSKELGLAKVERAVFAQFRRDYILSGMSHALSGKP